MSDSAVESESFELIVSGRPRDLGGLTVRRVLPSMRRRLVGPFVFFDHMGPASWEPGHGMDVRPHPHISLATVTYLFEGEIDHRDSLGTFRTIRPGDVNWMLAGRGITHSERTGPSPRAQGSTLHGIQSWVALPASDEEIAPTFEHHPAATIPHVRREGSILDVVAGHGFGARSPVGVRSDTLYVHAQIAAGADLSIEAEHEERAIYVVDGALDADGRSFGAGTLLVLRPDQAVTVRAESASRQTRLMVIGGAHLDGERHIWWNFVSSSNERIERAKADWKAGRFPAIPGDDKEFIPLPES